MKRIITTENLYLRKFLKSDLENISELLADEEVMRFSMKGIRNKEQSAAILNSWVDSYKNGIYAPWALIYKEKLIGYAGLDNHIVENKNRVQLSYRLLKEYWGRGFATEIALAIKNYAFTSLGLKEIIAMVDPENKASVNTILKIGMEFDKKVVYEGVGLDLYVTWCKVD